MDHRQSLAVLPALRVGLTNRDAVILPRKFIDGMAKYAEYWDGPVMALMEPTDRSETNLDEEEVDPASLPFQLAIGSYTDPDVGRRLIGRRLVLGSVSYRQNHFSRLCETLGVPFVYVAEYALKTRLQMVWSTAANPAVALRRHWWELGQERQYRAAISRASGVQCNGSPTFEAYRSLNSDALLYFDTRTNPKMMIADEDLKARLDVLKRGGPLRLLFSGRLIAIKGADHLIRVARELRRLAVPFEMTICGGGALESEMRAAVKRFDLDDCVKMAGVLDFKEELTPFVKRWADVFVCCHRSGDPSCTYLETMSCGVPIVGYENEAFRGLVQESGAGWTTPIDRPSGIASKIAELSKNRAAVVEASYRALTFARRWTFDKVFEGRIEHLKSCSIRRRPTPL
jgi:colanic acid/amylovoran biosynthesis glycosyltransferase